MLSTSVAWIGPPPVVIHTRGKTCIVQMKSSKAMLMIDRHQLRERDVREL